MAPSSAARTATVTVFGKRTVARMLREDDALDGGEIPPGFQLPVRNIFAA